MSVKSCCVNCIHPIILELSPCTVFSRWHHHTCPDWCHSRTQQKFSATSSSSKVHSALWMLKVGKEKVSNFLQHSDPPRNRRITQQLKNNWHPNEEGGGCWGNEPLMGFALSAWQNHSHDDQRGEHSHSGCSSDVQCPPTWPIGAKWGDTPCTHHGGIILIHTLTQRRAIEENKWP